MKVSRYHATVPPNSSGTGRASKTLGTDLGFQPFGLALAAQPEKRPTSSGSTRNSQLGPERSTGSGGPAARAP